MGRGHLRHPVTDWLGRAVQYASANVYRSGTTTPPLMFTAETGGSPLSNPLITNNQGEIEAWLDAPLTVDVVVTDNGGAARVAATGAVVSFAGSVTETVFVPPTFKGQPWHDVTAEAADPTGVADARAAFVAAEVSDNVFVPPGTYRIASNLTLSKNLRFARGAKIKPDSGVTVTITGQIDAGPWKIFDLSAGGTVTLAPLLVTVGASGDYATVTEALSVLSRQRMTFVNGGQHVELRLLSGFTLAEQVDVRNIDLSYIKLTSVDATVPIQRSALTAVKGDVGEFPAFYFENAIGFVFACKFTMDTSGTATGRHGIQTRHSTLYFSSGHTSGVINAGGRGLNAQLNSVIFAANTDWYQATEIGVRVGNGSLVYLRGAYLYGSGSGLHVGTACVVHAVEIIATNCVTNGIFSLDSWTGALGADVSGCPTGIVVQRGGFVGAEGLIAVGCAIAIQAINAGTQVVASGGIGANLQNATNRAVSAESGATVDVAEANMSGSATAVYAEDGAIVNARATIANNCTSRGFQALYGARINARNASATGAGVEAARADQGGYINCNSATFTGGVTRGILAIQGGKINAASANCRKGGSDNPNDIVVLQAGEINAHSATGGLSVTANIITAAGLIFNAGAHMLTTANTWTQKQTFSGEVEIDGALNHDGNTVGFYGVTPVARSAAYTASNVTTDRTFDANATTIDEIADVLGTLLADLKLTGIIG
jgi:hypothetical protein